MKVKVRAAGKVQMVDLHGQLTIGGPERLLKDTVQGLLNDGHVQLLINMKGVDRIDSTGLGELVASRFRVQKKEGRVALVIPKGKVYDIFVISKLITIFAIYEEELEAVGSF
jgi:anti-anti-sigma factor